MTNRRVVEDFVSRVANELADDCTLVTLLPWTCPPAPPGVMTPVRHPEHGFQHDRDELEALERKSPRTVLVPCTFDSVAEEAAAQKLLPQLATRDAADDACVLLVYVCEHQLAGGDGDAVRHVLERHSKMINMVSDNVIVNPSPEPRAFRHDIRLARINWAMSVQRVEMLLESVPELVDAEALQRLQRQHRRLLWEGIPRVLMRSFPAIDRSLVDTGNSIGQYTWVKPYRTVHGTVMQAVSKDGQVFAVKIIDKAKVFFFSELEGVYREFRLLTGKAQHPNIAHCVELLHGANHLYLVFEFAGTANLKQRLESQPDHRFEGATRDSCILQIITALAHLHGKRISHRNVSLPHVVLMEAPGADHFDCRLVDFQCAMEAPDLATVSTTICGTLPCAAPEVILGGPYVPWLADCWSAGVVFIEMAGGLSSMSQSVGYNPDSPVDAAVAIQAFFADPASRQRVLTCTTNQAPDPYILELVERLVTPRAEERTLMQDAALRELLPVSADIGS
mmetsp:Transcript_110843/g.313653  ORF Transcript_110843/g.313653 Transcript_110843/m.313653 type:complete len:507 (+) Transcript_110843:182-1702(+)